MGTAYTPGLRVSSGTIVRKTRRLPLKGQVTVEQGDKVTADTVVARTDIPGIIQTVKVAENLGLEPADAIGALLVKEGDQIEAGHVVAMSRSFFGMFKSECKCQFKGTVELISNVTGHVGVRMPANPVEVTAYIDGEIAEVIEGEGVVIESYGAFVQGIFGVGGERTGILSIPVDSPDITLTEDLIWPEHEGKVLVAGSSVTIGALRRAAEMGVAGIVVGAIVDTDLVEYIGHDIGVAITGYEDIVTSLILTEGFGSIQMAKRTFDLLRSLNGRRVSISGATQIRAGVIRPEIICPLESRPDHAERPSRGQLLEVGSPIRIIREPYFGVLGTVSKLPHEPVVVESGAVVRILEAELADGRTIIVPRANIEIIET